MFWAVTVVEDDTGKVPAGTSTMVMLLHKFETWEATQGSMESVTVLKILRVRSWRILDVVDDVRRCPSVLNGEGFDAARASS